SVQEEEVAAGRFRTDSDHAARRETSPGGPVFQFDAPPASPGRSTSDRPARTRDMPQATAAGSAFTTRSDTMDRHGKPVWNAALVAMLAMATVSACGSPQEDAVTEAEDEAANAQVELK